VGLNEIAWQERLDAELAARHIPGAVLSVLVDGDVTTVASGVLNRATGVEVTPDSVFQIGSITKLWTTTLLARLVDEGRVGFDTKVIDVIKDFRVADPDVGGALEIRHLVNHTSGIEGDLHLDTGRGDDCVERYVARLSDAPQLHPTGATVSYCNSAFVIAGRVIEVLTGTGWDEALRQLLFEPLGLSHSMTLPEEALKFRAAWGHVGPWGSPPEPTRAWAFARAMGPAALGVASAPDLIAFAAMHFGSGRNAAGDEVLAPALVAEMQQVTVDMPNPSRRVDHIGLGWWLCDWSGRTIVGHDGNTVGHSSFLRFDPERQFAVALVVNGRETMALYDVIFRDLFAELDGVELPRFAPPAEPVSVDPAGIAGVYERSVLRVTIEPTPGGARARLEERFAPAGTPPEEHDLVPVREDVWAIQMQPNAPWGAWHFYDLADGTRLLHNGLQVTPKVR
jgi:CubicO group peptidase (beta-lactamase class C family)